MAINQRIEEIMFFFRKSGSDLANDLNVRSATITRTLKGETLPSAKLLIPLGEKLGVSIDWLLFGEGEMLRGNNPTKVVGNHRASEETNEADKIKLLEQQIELQREQIELLKGKVGDKDEIIKMLKEKNNS